MQRPPKLARAAAAIDRRVFSIHVYPDGWVPNAYQWPAKGVCLVYRRNGSRQWALHRTDNIDRKRSYGAGPRWVCRSADGGRLATQ